MTTQSTKVSPQVIILAALKKLHDLNQDNPEVKRSRIFLTKLKEERDVVAFARYFVRTYNESADMQARTTSATGDAYTARTLIYRTCKNIITQDRKGPDIDF